MPCRQLPSVSAQRTIINVRGPEKKEKAESALRAHSSSIRGSRRQAKIAEETVTKPEKLQPFIKEEVLVGIYNDVFPCTAEQFFTLLFSDDSKFTNEYRAARKDSNLVMGQWHAADEYDGQVFETVQQAHDVPFGSYFEIHGRWHLETIAENSSTIDIKVGAHFKKWCVIQFKIKTGAVNKYKKEVELMLETARSYIKTRTSGGETNNQSSTPSVLEIRKALFEWGLHRFGYLRRL
ncbi:hypothetical protein CUMW_084450 [Citrus unshiu]|nr:hypothetical protein CUMW_084450 [Citrus unshiu]GAY44777.1 hypothetical protein CUMW_084450 [Citrus unshiu]